MEGKKKMKNDSSWLIMNVKREKEIIKIYLEDGREIKILWKNSKTSRCNNSKVIAVNCPKSIKIKREENENFGNY